LNIGPIAASAAVPLASRRTRLIMVSILLGLLASAIGYLFALGDPANTIHTQGLGWCFTALMGITGAYLFNEGIERYAEIRSGR
jgi:ABC-type Mn2+/Zn2+ transport system permease subunit